MAEEPPGPSVFESGSSGLLFRRRVAEVQSVRELTRIQCPTLVFSDGDPLVSIEDARDMVAAMPRRLVQHEHFADAGHCIVGEEPARFFAIVRRFITGLGDAARKPSD